MQYCENIERRVIPDCDLQEHFIEILYEVCINLTGTINDGNGHKLTLLYMYSTNTGVRGALEPYNSTSSVHSGDDRAGTSFLDPTVL